LLAPDVVLTAAHCSVADTAEWGRGLEAQGRSFQRRAIVEKQIHPNFERSYYDWDIALFKLKEPFYDVPTLSFFNQSRPKDLVGFTFTVLGRGSTDHYLKFIPLWLSSDGQSDNFKKPIHEVNIKEVSIDSCRKAYNNAPLYTVITDNMLCARGPGADSCTGDSGGPLLIKGADVKEDILVGIVSWGNECGSPKYPGVYHRVSYSLRWITETFEKLTQSEVSPVFPLDSDSG